MCCSTGGIIGAGLAALSYPRQCFDLVLNLFRYILTSAAGEIPRCFCAGNRILQNDVAEVVLVIIGGPEHPQLILNFESGQRVTQNLQEARQAGLRQFDMHASRTGQDGVDTFLSPVGCRA